MTQTTTGPVEQAELTRIIAEDNLGQWSAWFTRAPGAIARGPSMKSAVAQLVQTHGLDPASVTLMYHGIGPRRHEFRIRSTVCPECRGSGQYVGLTTVESCQRCDGYGRL
jgi:hypothetical protein